MDGSFSSLLTFKHDKLNTTCTLELETKDFTIIEMAPTSPNSDLNVKALVGTFNQEKALVLGAFSVILKSSRTFVTSSTAHLWDSYCHQHQAVINLPSL